MSTSQSSATRKTGSVKFFNPTKGYGFILPKEQEGTDMVEDVFVHHSAIKNDGGFRSLCQDEEVEYNLVKGPKGMQATLVTAIGGGPVKGDQVDANQSYGQQQSQYQSHHGYRHIKQYTHQKHHQQHYYPEYYNGLSYYQLQGYSSTPSTYVYHHQHHHPPPPYQHRYSQQQGYATTTTTTSSSSTYYPSPSPNPPPAIIHYITSHSGPSHYSYPAPILPSSPIDSQPESY